METNGSLRFDRILAFQQCLRLDIPAGTAVRFEPGESKSVVLTPFGGKQIIQGGSGIATAVREKGLDVQSPEAIKLVKQLLHGGNFAVGDEGLAQEVSQPKEMEREVVSTVFPSRATALRPLTLLVLPVRFNVWSYYRRSSQIGRY